MLNLTDIDSILTRLTNKNNNQSAEITLVLDTNKRDVGVLIRLHHLQKRLQFVKYVLGDWKTAPKYTSITDQIEYVTRRFDLLDPQKL